MVLRPSCLYRSRNKAHEVRTNPHHICRTYLTNTNTSFLSSRNATSTPIKRTAVERQVNAQIVLLFILLLALSIGSSIGAVIRLWFFADKQWYLDLAAETSGLGAKIREFILGVCCLLHYSRPHLLTLTLYVTRHFNIRDPVQ